MLIQFLVPQSYRLYSFQSYLDQQLSSHPVQGDFFFHIYTIQLYYFVIICVHSLSCKVLLVLIKEQQYVLKTIVLYRIVSLFTQFPVLHILNLPSDLFILAVVWTFPDAVLLIQRVYYLLMLRSFTKRKCIPFNSSSCLMVQFIILLNNI